jgi:putative aldouronate transport system substrate-binding protein
MKNLKKTLSLLLAACMTLGLLAGCGGTESTASTASAKEEAAETEQSASVAEETETPEIPEIPAEAESAEEPEASSAEEAEPGVDLTIDLPLTEDDISFTMWHDFVPPLADYMDGMQDNLVYQTMEERTGVHMEITSVNKDQSATAVALLVASGDYPDIWDGFSTYYTSSIDSAIEAEIIVDLAEYKDLLPNYFTLVDGNEEYAKETYTDSGAMGLAYTLNEKQVMESGLVVRQDWLDALNLDTPVTYDDFTEVLTAMHDAYGATFWTTYLGDDCIKSISAGFGITAYNVGSETYFEQIDGEVVFSPLQEGYLEYVTLMNDWYNAGILYPDFVSGTGTTTCDADLMGSGKISMVATPAGPVDQFYSATDDPDFNLAAVSRPVKNVGDQVHQGSTVVMTSDNGFSVSTAVDPSSEEFEILMKWLDYWYTDEGSLLANYGVEGVTFEYEDGTPVFTDLMTNNPDGIAFTLCMNRYVLFVGSFKNDNTRSQVNYTEKQAELVDVWTQNPGDGSYVYPTAVSLTTEESDAFTASYSDIATYVSSETLGFITGSVPLSDYDSFCDNIRAMGIDELIDIYQAALDRYNAR